MSFLERVKKHIVTLTVLLITVYWATQIYQGKKWVNSDSISEDVEMTYNYLPAILIYGDVSCEYKFALDKHIQHKIWAKETKDGKPYFKQTIGTSICVLPFFGIAHLIAKNTSYKADGYSEIYALLLQISGLFYGVFGLFIVSILLKYYFNNWVVALSILSIAIATNLNYYVTDHLYSHVYSFCLIALFLLLTHKWYIKRTLISAILIGLILGLIVLIRPPNGIIVLFFIFYRFSSFKEQFILFKTEIKHLAIMGIATVLAVSIQLVYWKITTGHWSVSTYDSHTFGYYDNPQILNILFSYRKGWLLYTPIMIFAVLGFFLALKREVKYVKWAIGLTLLLHIYIISSWNAWWFGGSYGARPMVDYYALLAFPLAAFYNRFKFLWFLIVPICMILTGLNIFQEHQLKLGLFHWDGMTKEAYWNVWGETTFPKDYEKYVVRPDYERTLIGKEEYVSSIDQFHLKSSEIIMGNRENGKCVLDSANSISMYTFALENRYVSNARNRYAVHVYYNIEEASSVDQYLFWVGFIDQNFERKFGQDVLPWPCHVSTTEQNDLGCYVDWFEPFNEGDSVYVSGVYYFGKPVLIDSVKVEHFVYEYED
jgi:hypothetical protein